MSYVWINCKFSSRETSVTAAARPAGRKEMTWPWVVWCLKFDPA